jgi:hypothetical protein
VQLVCLDQVLDLAAGAVDGLVEPSRRALQVGDDEPAAAAPGRCLDPGDDPSHVTSLQQNGEDLQQNGEDKRGPPIEPPIDASSP